MATAGSYSNLGHQKKKETVNNNEEKTRNIKGTDPNLGHEKKKAGVNNNESFEEIPELTLQQLNYGSES